MSSPRVTFALAQGGLSLPDGPIALFGAPGDAPLDGLPQDRCTIVQTFYPDFDAWERRGMVPVAQAQGPYAASILTLPRARDLALARLAEAERATPDGLIVLDGAKTDGIEAIAKALRGRVEILGQVSKAHGKCLWFRATGSLQDWARAPVPNASGDITAPGVFSADKPDPASIALAAALPDGLKGQVADLGAGWGWLSREILKRDGVRGLHLVEAELSALDCARLNVTDTRAAYHWADATTWKPPAALDVVVMNPPFHIGRKADPALGRAFITAAARMLAPHGRLWMVANRHLPYETALASSFVESKEIAGTSAFKILAAARPTRTRR